MFWGLILEPQRRYSQVVKRSFHISKASLDIFASTDKPCQVMLTSQERNYLLCTLQKDTKLQCNLDLNFIEGEEVMFATNGGSNVHLTGYLIEEELDSEDDDAATTEEDEQEEVVVGRKRKNQLSHGEPKKKTKTELLLEEIDADYNSEEDPTYPNIEDEDIESEEIDDDADEDDSDESGDDVSNLSSEDIFINGGSGKRQLRKSVQTLLNKSEDDSESDAEEEEEEEEEKPVKQKSQSKVNGVSKVKKEKHSKADKSAKQQKAVKESPKPDKVSNKSQESKSPKKVRQIEGGVSILDLKEGDGKLVKNGKVVQVYYEGRLKANNKLFDSANKGAGFKFRVGKKEVIKGWDVGLVGMKVGGKRRIVCPPHMAYGPQGSGSVIPPNSTLIFDVEVKNVS